MLDIFFKVMEFPFKSFILHTFLALHIVTIVSKYCIITVENRLSGLVGTSVNSPDNREYEY